MNYSPQSGTSGVVHTQALELYSKLGIHLGNMLPSTIKTQSHSLHLVIGAVVGIWVQNATIVYPDLYTGTRAVFHAWVYKM